MRVSAKADYALRAVAELAAAEPGPLKRERIADAQQIPMNYLENILLELKHAGIVQSQRGTSGGFRLARRPADISLADVIRAVDGPMANVRGSRPEEVEYLGPAEHLRDVWVAVRAAPPRAAGDDIGPGPDRRDPAEAHGRAHRGAGRLGQPGARSRLGPRPRRQHRLVAYSFASTRPQRRRTAASSRAEQQRVHHDPDHQDHDHGRQQPAGVIELA